jgi:hypothetical protein
MRNVTLASLQAPPASTILAAGHSAKASVARNRRRPMESALRASSAAARVGERAAAAGNAVGQIETCPGGQSPPRSP